MRRAYFSLGSNMGDRAAYLRLGVDIVAAGRAVRLSQVYRSEPVGGVVQDDFWNLVMELATDEEPRALLELAHAAEAAAHRQRRVRWGPRTLDVDIVWIDEVVCAEAELVVPHPRMYERNFVLVPLRELREDLVTPAHLAVAVGAVLPMGTLETLL